MRTTVDGFFSERELAWLAADLAAKPVGMPVIVGIHIPLVTNYSQRRGSPPEGVPPWIVGNAAEVRKLLEAHDTRLVLQGHVTVHGPGKRGTAIWRCHGCDGRDNGWLPTAATTAYCGAPRKTRACHTRRLFCPVGT